LIQKVTKKIKKIRTFSAHSHRTPGGSSAHALFYGSFAYLWYFMDVPVISAKNREGLILGFSPIVAHIAIIVAFVARTKHPWIRYSYFSQYLILKNNLLKTEPRQGFNPEGPIAPGANPGLRMNIIYWFLAAASARSNSAFRQKQGIFGYRIFSHRCARCESRCGRCEKNAYGKRVFSLPPKTGKSKSYLSAFSQDSIPTTQD
jgi:hypothetical protein